MTRLAFRSDEHGETLIELLVTMVVMGIGLVGIVAALGGSIIASGSHRSLAKGEVVTRDFGEAVKAKANDASTHDVCPTAAQLTPTFSAPGWTLTIDPAVEYWIPDATNFPNGGWVNRGEVDDNEADDPSCFRSYNLCTLTISACDPGFVRVKVTAVNDRTDAASATVVSRLLVRRNNAA